MLAAARASFGTKGYAQTSVDQIAAAARVTKGAVYHHFAGKEALFRAVFAEVEAEARARAVGAGDPNSPPIEQIVAQLNAYLDVALDPEVKRITLIDGPAVLGLEPGSRRRPAGGPRGAAGVHRRGDRAAARSSTSIPDVLADVVGGLALLGGLLIARAGDPGRDQSGARAGDRGDAPRAGSGRGAVNRRARIGLAA